MQLLDQVWKYTRGRFHASTVINVIPFHFVTHLGAVHFVLTTYVHPSWKEVSTVYAVPLQAVGDISA